MAEFRIEKDSMGEIEVPADRYWGAQTERSRVHFPIGEPASMPKPVIRAFAFLKKACALANVDTGVLAKEKADIIAAVCEEILAGKLDEHFPLVVWQTGSGTQTNMNVNEVVANRGNEMAAQKLLHPNDDVNRSQSSNDTYPSALHVAAVLEIEERLVPSLEALVASFKALEDKNSGIVKCGRTHLQDATPIAFSQEISGWRVMLEKTLAYIRKAVPELCELALGGTAVGTGLNAPKGFAEAAAAHMASLTGQPFVTAENKFHSLTSRDGLVFAHGALKALAADLMKIANDIRWLSSGPRLGLGEIRIPENEPGSSIMPGKVNPTQCEAITMIAVQVMANDVAVGLAASQGNFELNVFLPVTAKNFLESVRLLADGMHAFRTYCVDGIEPVTEKMEENLHRSLMTVTALTPVIGYDNAAKVAKKAHKENLTLKEACVALGVLDADRFDELYHPERMI